MELAQDLGLEPRLPRQQCARETEDENPLVGLPHGCHRRLVVQRWGNLQALVFALSFGRADLVQEVSRPSPEGVVIDMLVAVDVELPSILKLHLDGLLDGISKGGGVPRVHAERSCPQGLRRAGELREDQHAAVLLLLAPDKLMGFPGESVTQRRVHKHMRFDHEGSYVSSADVLVEEVKRRMRDGPESRVALAPHLIDLLQQLLPLLPCLWSLLVVRFGSNHQLDEDDV
mmetsp:Transcript_13132/g.31118  ORF Transcript_13132/g.31118 Transcript_13132/m.31118 type:complete len:230 (+) Transcript_13132:1298-1987(+)